MVLPAQRFYSRICKYSSPAEVCPQYNKKGFEMSNGREKNILTRITFLSGEASTIVSLRPLGWTRNLP
jgi:hypothetical protein